jgi:hypothetical protein
MEADRAGISAVGYQQFGYASWIMAAYLVPTCTSTPTSSS